MREFFDRELSWLEFNRRVLAEAADRGVPLLERVKFLSIAANNLDEFLMVRAAAIRGIRTRVKSFLRELDGVYEDVAAELKRAGVRIGTARGAALPDIPETQPAPIPASGAVQLAIVSSAKSIAFLQMPPSLPRFIAVPGRGTSFVPIEEVVRMHAARFFPGITAEEIVPFRVLRNADDVREAVWMEIGRDASEFLIGLLQRELGIGPEDTWLTAHIPKLSDLMEIYDRVGKPSLREEPFTPRMPAELAAGGDLFSVIRGGDVLLHRPYDSFEAVVEFIQRAADDPDVVAIQQTLYRTGDESVVVEALARAAERGKQVTVVVELQARFDEARNIGWARRLEEAGVQVVHGLAGLKTHCKLCLVVRREGDALRRYVHLSTGNYNATTARQYSDLDLLTARADFGEDAEQLMRLLTAHASRWEWKRLVVAPMRYHAWVLAMIGREETHARAKRPAKIIAKMNALVDPAVIRALYGAAAAGVKIELIVRGTCCLVPRKNIRVISIVDRFLEHSRTFVFRNGGKTEVWIASGDWMPRNFFRRVELAWPVLDPALCDRIEREILATCLADDTHAWLLQRNGTYRRRKPTRGVRSQQRFIDVDYRTLSVPPGARLIVIGDIHGCFDELTELLARVDPREGDVVVSTGDIVRKGPAVARCLELWRERGYHAVRGNNEIRLLKHATFRRRDLLRYIASWPLVLDIPTHNVAIVHGGFLPQMHVTAEDVEREKDVIPKLRWIRRSYGSWKYVPKEKRAEGDVLWPEQWPGPRFVVYGHTPLREPKFDRFALGLDTGCVYGGALTAAILEGGRWRTVSVPARRAYAD